MCSLCCLELTSKRCVVDVELVAHTRSRLKSRNNVSVATTLGAADAEAIHNDFIFPDEYYNYNSTRQENDKKQSIKT